MSKNPLLEMGNISIEKLVLEPNRDEDVIPYGLGLPIYATDPDPESNRPGTVIFNSTDNTVNVARNDGTYASLSYTGDVSANVILASYDTDGEAPAKNGSIYLNTDDFPSTVRYYVGGQFNSMLAAQGGAINTFSTQFINLPTATSSGQAVEYDQFVAAPFLSDTSTLNAIATANATSDDIPMNNNKLTGLTAGTIAGDSVEYNQLVTAAFWVNTASLSDISAANPTAANISMNSHKITSLTAGSSSGEAVEYGQLSGFYANTVPLQSITKATADVDINTHKLLNVVDPASAQDAATKNYVDTTTLPVASTLNAIATANAVTANISMNSHKLTGLTPGAATGEAVEYDQLVAAAGTHASFSMWLTTPASTTITVAGTMYKLAGTFAYGSANNFDHGGNSNRFVYTGATTITAQMNVSATLSHDAVATTTNIRVAIMKNGVTLLGSSSSALQSGGSALVNIPVNLSTVGQTPMVTNDYLEIFVTTDAIVGTTNVVPVAVLATISAV